MCGSIAEYATPKNDCRSSRCCSVAQGLSQWVSSLHQLAKGWSFSFSFYPSNEFAGLISFRIDWFDLLAVQGTQEFSPAPQFESITSLALTLLYGPNLISVHDYWKTIALSIQTLSAKCSLLFNVLSMYHHKHTTVVYWLVWAVTLEKQQMQGDVCELLLNMDLKGIWFS